MITLNQIKHTISSFFTSHKQVRHFFYGDANKYSGIVNKDFISVNCEYISSTLSGKALNHSFRISIADRIDPNHQEQEDEVISDAILIANDFFAFIDLQEEILFTKSSSLQPFSDDNRDRTAGIVFTLILQVQRKANNCITPINN